MVTVISHLIDGAAGEAALLHVEWQRAKTEYPDITLHHLEALLKIRNDLSAKDVKRVIQDCILKKEMKESKKKGRGDAEKEPPDPAYLASRAFFTYIAVSQSTDFTKEQK